MSDFELDSALKQWRNTVKKELSLTSQQLDEIFDHLECEIENRIAQGMSEKIAFACAIEQIKQHPYLEQSYRSKSAILDKLIVLETCGQGGKSNYLNAKKVVYQSLLWASALIATAILVGDHANASFLNLFIMTPLALSSIVLAKKM